MSFKGRIITFLIILLSFSVSTKSQTLYWVGGSGNFTDGKHWSYTDGGQASNTVPNNQTTVVFGNSVSNNVVIVITNQISVKGLEVKTYNNIKFESDNPQSRVIIESAFINNNNNVNFSSDVIFEFKNNFNSSFGEINSAGFEFKTDIVISGGKWKINGLKTDSNHSLLLTNATSVNFNSSFIRVDNFNANSCKFISFNKTTLLISNDFIFYGIDSFEVNKSYLNTKLFNHKSIDEDKSGIASKFASSNSVFLSCAGVSNIIPPSCLPGCNGSFVLTIPNYSCFATAPTTPSLNVLFVSGGGCPVIPGINNLVPGSYTIANVCACLSAYGIVILDGNGIFIDNINVSITQPVITNLPPSTASINCNGACTGSLSTGFFGGIAPYNFTVTPSGGSPSFSTTNGNVSATNLCAGILTITASDLQGCSNTYTFDVQQPPVLNFQGSTTSITCNGNCNGIAAVTPTGGTASYTVTWSTGASSVLTSGQTSSITGLCPSVVTATLDDSKGCTYPTFVATITQPPALTVTPTHTNLTCNSLCTGAASVSVSGGVFPYSYSWSPGISSSNSLTSLCAGPQTVTVSYNGVCSQTQSFAITQPAAITLAPTVTNVICNGLCTGAASVSAVGGVGAITFTWAALGSSNIATTSSITAQCAGAYTIFATDASTCLASTTISITQPPALTLTAISQSIACFGVCTGASTANVSGGNGAPYNYSWTPGLITGQGTATVSNLCANNYSLAVFDASNCPINTTIAITQPSNISLNITTTSITCNSLCNGVINANPVGGLPPFTYSLVTPLGATIVTAPPYTGLCAGTYTLFVEDLAPCVKSQTIHIAEPNPLVATINSVSITCFNSCNGSLAGNIAGGTPSYSLNWDTPGGLVPGGIIGALCAGTYTFLAVDFNGCTTSSIVTLSQPSGITATLNAINPSCNSTCNGILNASILGGVPGYVLNWSNGFSGNPNIGLCGGNYTLTVSDLNGCSQTFTTSLIAPPALTLTVNTTSVSCAGGCDGSATVTAAGGSPGLLTYQFNTLPFPTTNTTGIISGLCAGGYIVTVNDASGCSQTTPITINQPIALSVLVTGIDNSCNVCTGAATVSLSNGTPTYAIAWTNNLGTTISNSSVAINLCPGNYTATATDSRGCTATATANIVQTVSLTVVSIGGGIQCFGACTGSAIANAFGGILPYSYTWTPTSQSTQTVGNLCAGNYTVTVADVLGCSNTSTISFVDPPDIILTTTQASVSCFGLSNGFINSNASGGAGTLTYSWSPGGQTTPNISGLTAGNYTLVVSDANGCSKTQTFAITQPPQISATFTTTNPSACVVGNGSICATPSGGSGSGYTFTWSPGGGVGINSSCYTNLPAGSYALIVEDNAGCTSTLSSLLTNPIGPTLTIASTSVNCFGGNTGVISATATGISPFTFTWTPAVAVINTTNTSTAINLASGIYNISSTDNNGCITSQTVAVTQASSLNVLSTIDTPKCNSLCNGSITLVTSGATPGYSFNWIPSASITVGQGTGTVSGLCAGNYSVIITDLNACVNTLTFNVNQPTPLTITTNSNNVACNGACNGSATANAAGGTGAISYTWPAVGTFTGSNSANVFSLCPAIYTVTATDANLCSITQTLQITEPPALTSTVVLLSASCSNSCNAIATHTASGGTPTYSYSWSSAAATTSTLGNLCSGNYTATITDANGCVSAKPFTVTAPPPFTGTLTPQNPLCNAACNGSINTTLAGAQGTVIFAWIPSGTGQNPVGLCANNYTLIAIDSVGCQFISSVNVAQPAAILPNVTFTNPSCFGSCDGVAISNPANAQGAVSVTWSPGGQSTSSITALCSGNYSVFVQDANGCQNQQIFTLINPPLLTINSSAAPARCNSPNGSITVIAVGGTPNYTYTWAAPIVSSNSVVTGLPAGIYTVTVTDSQNCSNTLSIPLSNSNGPSSASIISNSVNCNGQCTGAASVDIGSIIGGTPSYTVAWVSPPSATTVNPQTNLCAGNYIAQITDALGCILFSGVTISQPSALSISPNYGLPSCSSVCNGSISLNTSGGGGSYNYVWTPVNPSGSSTTFTSACAGNYTVLIQDNNLCSLTQTLNLLAVTNLLGVISSSNNSCFGNCSGIASITSITGGLAPYSYNWSNGQTTGIANALCNGNYSVVVTDFNGCSNTFTSTILSPAPINANTAIIQPSCGICNGSSTVSAFGGTAPYTYTWSSGSTGTITSGLCAGLYQVTIDDMLGCQTTQTIIINNSSGITANTQTVSNEQCFGSCTGAATVQAVGGTAPITYNWLSPVVSNSVVTGLCGGSTYFVQMTDAVGCIRTDSVSINSAIQLSLTPAITAPGCGLANGTINVTPSGGTPTYTFAWVPAGSSSSLTNISAGSYTLTVTDNNLCSLTQVFNVNNVTGPLITSTLSNINCFNACTGSITALGTTTALPVSYHWSNGANTASVTGLCSGVITLTVTDSNNCETIQTFTITENSQLQVGALAIQQPACGLCNGSSTVSAFGGAAPYTYTWTNGSLVNTASNLCAGLYQVSITDGLGCNVLQNVIINNSNGITGQVTNVSNEQCFGDCNGSATVTAIGGSAPISYSWISPSSTNSVVNNLCAGNYFVQMIDANGCIRSTSLTVNSGAQLNLTPFVSLPNCTPGNNGSITVVVSGGTPTYSFSWSTGATTPSLSNIGAGSYTLNVVDNNLCTQSQVFNISNSTGPFVTALQSDIDCFGACTGSILANATSTALPLSYLWSNGVTSASVSNLCFGVITLTVTDGNLCKTIQSYTIVDNSDIQFSIPNIQSLKCFGDCNGAITLIPSGGVLPYTYSWSPGGSTSNPLSALCSGDYVAIIEDSKGCSKSQTLTLTEPPAIVVTSTLNNSSCSTIADGGASVTVSGGTPTYTYNWFGPSTFTSNAQNITTIFSGSYSLNVTDNNGCIKNTILQVVPTITITADAGNSALVCPTTSVVLTATNSVGAVIYNWFLLPNILTPIATTPTLFVTSNAVGASTFVLQTISSSSLCVAFDTVVVNSFPLPTVDAGPSYTISVFSTVVIGGSPTSNSGNTFTWTPSFTLDDSTIANPVASNTVNTTYTVSVTDAVTGCIANDTVQVIVYPEVVIPNGFSPNGDSKNERWIIDNIQQFPENTVEVYNRWGERLFYSQGYAVPFDGRYKGKDLPVGTYYYIINLNHPAYTKAYTGPLTIFR